MHAVFGLVPDHRLRAVDDFGGDFFAPVRGQAVHEQGIGLGGGHHVGIDAPVGKGFAALFVFGLVAHAGPDIGGDQVGTLAGFFRVAKNFVAACARCAAAKGQFFIHFVAVGGAHMHGKAQQIGRLQPGVGHVVAIAHPGDDLAGDAATVLDEGEDVGQDLAGVKFVGQAVDHRHARILGKALDLVLAKGADHDQIGHAADDAGAVLDGLGAAQLAVIGRQVDDAAAQLVHARFKADAGACAGLFKNHGQGAIHQGVVLFVGFEFLFNQRGAGEQVVVLGSGEVGKLQVVFQGGHTNPFSSGVCGQQRLNQRL